jgi:WD40 repeat protein
VLCTPPHASYPHGLADNLVHIWHRQRLELLETLEGHEGIVNDVSWHPRNPEVFASASDDHTVIVWSTVGSGAVTSGGGVWISPALPASFVSPGLRRPHPSPSSFVVFRPIMQRSLAREGKMGHSKVAACRLCSHLRAAMRP